jgi:hypothetical protein
MAWNDYTNWTSVDTVRLTAPLDGILPVVKAVNERCVVAGISTITEPNMLDGFNLTSSIQSKVSQLINLFVNQETNGGDYTGLSEIPMWTEADILISIGAAERLEEPTKLYELSADWLYQQYLILNKLVWYVENAKQQNQRAQEGIGLSVWQTAEEAMAEAAGNIVEKLSTPYAGSQQARFELTTTWQFRAGNNYYDFRPDSIFLNAPDIKAKSSIYAFINGESTPQDYFWSFDLNLNENEFIKVEELESLNVSNIYYNDLLKPNFNIYPTTVTEDDIVQGGLSVGFRYTTPTIVYEFNVTGGFEYV